MAEEQGSEIGPHANRSARPDGLGEEERIRWACASRWDQQRLRESATVSPPHCWSPKGAVLSDQHSTPCRCGAPGGIRTPDLLIRSQANPWGF
jgi:hypothetical protein